MDPLLLLKPLIPRPMGARGRDQKGGQATQPAAECSSSPKGLRWPPAPQIPPAFPLLWHPAAPLPFLDQTCLALAVTSLARSPVAAQALGTALCLTTVRSGHLRRSAWGASLQPHLKPCQRDEAEGKETAQSVPPAGR